MNVKGWELLLAIVLIIVPLVVWIWLSIWIGKKAQEKGYSRAGFTIFALLLTLVALIVVLVIQPAVPTTTTATATCPYCAEAIQPAAVVCKHCGRDLPAAP